MSTHFAKGDRVDWHHYVNGEVMRVGLGTIWCNFETPHGMLAAPVPVDQARPHRSNCSIRIGGFQLRTYGPGKLHIESTVSGEAGVFDEAQLESLVEKFWRKEF